MKVVREQTLYNHWGNSTSVITWFKNLEAKNNLSFMQFDIVEFYPSISEHLLTHAIDFAAQYMTLTQQEKQIIFQTKKTLLFNNGQTWVKKENKDFNVSMGSWDGAEVCEIVGLFLLSKLQHLALNVGLYRDDGLAVTKLKPRLAELEKKKVCKIMSEYGLKITATANAHSVNFLDLTLDLREDTYKPFMKPNDVPLYVHRQSNHPQTVLDNIPLSVNRRLSSNSSNEEIFNNSCKPFQEALKKSGYKFKLEYKPPEENNNKKSQHSRNITWFNPPFSMSVKTRIGEKFLKLLKKCFPSYHPLHKIINKNTVKISYRCMPNMKQEVSKHNWQVQKTREPGPGTEGCNCQDKDDCPLVGNCLARSVIYRAEVLEDNGTRNTYTGLTGNTFKERYYGHASSFRNRSKENSTTLSTHIWQLKNENKNYNIKWKIIDRGKIFNPTNRKCNLCLKEKYHIIFQPEGASLNKRSELFSACRHRRQKLLENVKD